MRWTHLILILGFQTLSLLAAAGNLRLVAWTTPQNLIPLVLPVRENEEPLDSAKRYLEELQKDPQMRELFSNQALPDLSHSVFQELRSSQVQEQVLLIANLPKDYGKNSHRLQRFSTVFKSQGLKNFLLPILANAGLSLAETNDFHNLLIQAFPLAVAMGGDDIDPQLYGQKNTHSKNINPTRDQYELSFLRDYMHSEKGFLLGVCRGSQMAAVALGYSMVQDIPAQIDNHISHADDWHEVQILPVPNNPLSQVLKPKSDQLMIYSFHHQAIAFNRQGPLQVLAKSSDGVVEATGLKSGRGLFLQFHPELMENELGNQILHQVVVEQSKIGSGMGGLCSKAL
jgi:putative glutamine amidotransferase